MEKHEIQNLTNLIENLLVKESINDSYHIAKTEFIDSHFYIDIIADGECVSESDKHLMQRIQKICELSAGDATVVFRNNPKYFEKS